MKLEDEIIRFLKDREASFVRFVDISGLPEHQTKQYSKAIIFGIPLTPEYLRKVRDTPDYVQTRIENHIGFSDDELYLTELKTDALSDELAALLQRASYDAYSHSDKNQIDTGFFDGVYGETPLPHKTAAVLAGLGWIGKNNLLVTPGYGSGLCLGAVLTNAPIKACREKPAEPACGNCRVCTDICKPGVLKGTLRNALTKREDIIDVYRCTTCMKCLVFCPWTKRYIDACPN